MLSKITSKVHFEFVSNFYNHPKNVLLSGIIYTYSSMSLQHSFLYTVRHAHWVQTLPSSGVIFPFTLPIFLCCTLHAKTLNFQFNFKTSPFLVGWFRFGLHSTFWLFVFKSLTNNNRQNNAKVPNWTKSSNT